MDKILRHFEMRHLEQPPAPETYDGFVYGHFGYFENRVRELVESGKRCYRYFNVLSFPRDDWSDPWFDYVRSSVVPLAKDGRLAWMPGDWEFGGRKLFDWSHFTNQRLKAIARKIADLADGQGVFLDQLWMEPRDWMMSSRAPDGSQASVYADFPQTKWVRYQANMAYFLGQLHSMVAPKPVLLNGDRLAPGALHLEWPHWYDLEQELGRWRESSDAVLAPLADIGWSVDWGIQEWVGSGKWLAFTCQQAGLDDLAYARAHAARLR